MCACVMLPFLRVQTMACGSWLTLCLSNFCSTFSNLEETEMELLFTSLLVLWRMYYKDLMVCRVPIGVRKILTCMFWDSKVFLPHFQLWQDVKNEKGFSTAKPVKVLPLSLRVFRVLKICFCSLVMQTIWFIYFTMIYLNIIKNTIFIGKIMIIMIYKWKSVIMRKRFLKVLVNYLIVNISLLNL